MKKRDRRKKARKERKARERAEYEAQRARDHETWLARPLTEAERQRAINRFRSLRHRGFRYGFVPTDIVVKAKNPEEFNRKVEEELARVTGGMEQN